jgi:hypothetical protein
MNNKKISPAFFLIVILATLAAWSCRKDFSKISVADWQPEFAAPFIHTTIVLSNLFPDDSNLVVQDDSSLVYFYLKDSVFSLSADTALDFTDDIVVDQSFSLGELLMSDFGFNSVFTMSEILPFLDQAIQDTLLKYDGQQNYFPPFSLLEPAVVGSEPIEDFVQLEFSDGKMIVTVSNNLPVPLNNIDFQLLDQTNQNIITEIAIDQLAPSAQVSDTTLLTGMTLGNEFSFKILSLESPGSFPDMVLIDLNQGLGFDLLATGLKVVGGQAKIIDQIMYSDMKMIDFGLDPEQLKHISFMSGNFVYVLNSEVNIDINVNIQLPTALINNEIPQQEFIINANGSTQQTWDVSSMTTDLTTDPDQPYNRMPVQIMLTVLPTDNVVTFDSSDKINGYFSLEQIKLDFADGYMGKQTVNISQDTFDLNFDFLKRLKGELILEDPSITMGYVNSIGVPFRISTEFLAYNSESGQSHYLEMDSVDIQTPSQVGDSVEGKIIIDKTNSSIVDFLAIRPDRIIYYGGGISNPEGENLNFITQNSRLTADAEIKIPLILRADHLNFVDTLGFSASSEGFPVQEGAVKLNIMNGFPFDLTMSMVLTDSISGQIIDKLTFDEIASAEVDETGKVIGKKASEITIDFSKEFLDNMKLSNQAFLEVETSTFGQGGVPVVLYSDYEIDITIAFTGKIKP